MKLELKDYKLTEDDFDRLPTLEKRVYILQAEQEDTMWYQKIVAKIQLIGFVISIAVLAAFLLSLLTK